MIREGLFTSETPEEQDGRWKWIRFSAAASPGNSGGPLLDAPGNVIGVVIAKSPNENLNYALPIANVLDAPQLRARFDQRVLTKLPYAQGSKTYVMKDEFTLPLSWEKFVHAYQAVSERHSDTARSALLSAYASSLFPRGSGTEEILYGPNTSSREPALVIQQDDGNWVIQAPDYNFTDLPGDGKVGVASAAGAVLLALHRGNEESDDAFYANSKSFMDIALKALNVRRSVGSDQVKVVSLGPALTDVMSTDGYGRKWQLRVWPLPFLDFYLVAQLLPTPDGYIGLVEYAPSASLRQAKIALSLLANQVSLTYVGTMSQWRAFLSRPALLPETLKDVTLDTGSECKLHTRRFETGVPSDLMKMDSHSELLLSMNYTFDGPRVVWDIGGAWWYPDAQEKAYVGLWRKPRPPLTAKLETRTRFDDLQARRSPYDGSPVQASSDAVDVSIAIQAPGTKDGMASSDVAYGLSLRLSGRPSAEQIAGYEAEAAQAAHILERGAGEDVAESAPTTVSMQMDALLKTARENSKKCDNQSGKDIRGHLCSDDFEQYITPLYQAAYRAPLGSASADDLRKIFSERAQAYQEYWYVAPGVVHNRDLWRPFLIHNHLSEDTPHDAAVLAAESSLNALFSQPGPPTADWARYSRALQKAYVDERSRIARKLAFDPSTVATSYRRRKSSCPEPAVRTSGADKPRPGFSSHSMDEFYPEALRRLSVEGFVVLSVRVNSAGCGMEAAVLVSSGAGEFDEAALNWAETETFLPAEKDGKATDGTGPMAIVFKLH